MKKQQQMGGISPHSRQIAEKLTSYFSERAKKEYQ